MSLLAPLIEKKHSVKLEVQISYLKNIGGMRED